MYKKTFETRYFYIFHEIYTKQNFHEFYLTGPRSKRKRLFQLEDLYLDIQSVDEQPMKGKYEKKLERCEIYKLK